MQRISDTHESDVMHVTKELVSNIVNSVEGTEWPPTAEYCVEYKCKCWPMGFDEGHIRYFDDKDALDTWLDAQREWACLEDNEMTYVLLAWDLGPTFVTSGHLY